MKSQTDSPQCANQFRFLDNKLIESPQSSALSSTIVSARTKSRKPHQGYRNNFVHRLNNAWSSVSWEELDVQRD
jgi:hypothetical protein